MAIIVMASILFITLMSSDVGQQDIRFN
jgi:hypothetical protein